LGGQQFGGELPNRLRPDINPGPAVRDIVSFYPDFALARDIVGDQMVHRQEDFHILLFGLGHIFLATSSDSLSSLEFPMDLPCSFEEGVGHSAAD